MKKTNLEKKKKMTTYHGLNMPKASLTLSGTTHTINYPCGELTTAALTTAAGAATTITVNNSFVGTNSIVLCSYKTYSGTLVTNGIPLVRINNVVNGAFDLVISNEGAANALSGVIVAEFVVVNPVREFHSSSIKAPTSV